MPNVVCNDYYVYFQYIRGTEVISVNYISQLCPGSDSSLVLS